MPEEVPSLCYFNVRGKVEIGGLFYFIFEKESIYPMYSSVTKMNEYHQGVGGGVEEKKKNLYI